jgi:hypothetical protein
MKRSTSMSQWIRSIGAAALILGISVAGSSPISAQAKAKSKGAKGAGADIMLMQPKAAKTGDNQFEVMVKGADGKPISDADVSVLLVMPKTAKMAEMRNEVKLKPSGNGMYMGSGNVAMSGKWNTTVMVMKDGKDIGQKKVTLTAK